MSEESKKLFLAIEDEAWILRKALDVAKEYAGSANCNPSYIPDLIEEVVHLLKTGENPRG